MWERNVIPFALQRLFETLFEPVNKFQGVLEMRAGMHVGFHVT